MDPAPVAPPAFTRRLALLLGVQMLFGFSFSLFFMLPKFMKTDLNADAGQIGMVAATSGLAGVFGIPLIAIAVDRFGRRPLVTAGTLLTAVVALLFFWVDEVGPLLYAARALQGLGFALAFNAATTMAADQAPADRLGQVIGWVGVSFLSMNALGPLTAEPLSEALGWPAVFALAAVLAVLAAGLSLVLHDVTRQRLGTDIGPPRNRSSWAVLRRPRMQRLLLVSAAGGVGLGTLFTFHQPYALELGAGRISSFFVGYTVAAVGVRLTLGSVADRVGRHRVALVATAAYALVVASLAWLQPEWLVLFGIAFGLAHGLFYPALNALTVEGLEDDERGKAMAFFNGAFNAGFAASTLALGYVADAYGYPAVFLTASVWVACAVPVLWGAGESSPARANVPESDSPPPTT